MAERRMFAKAIIDSDAFLDMPVSAQALYFHLNMRADDDGFVGNAKSILRMVGAKEDDFKLLVAKKFIILFDSGVIVVKHWRINNYLRNDRYKETSYLEEKNQLFIKENKSYTIDQQKGVPLVSINGGIPNGNQMATQISIGKDSIGKDSIDKDKEEKKTSIIIDEKESDLQPYNQSDIDEVVACLEENFLKTGDRIKATNYKIIEKWFCLDNYSKEFIIKGIEKVALNGDALGKFNYLDKALVNMAKESANQSSGDETIDITEEQFAELIVAARAKKGLPV